MQLIIEQGICVKGTETKISAKTGKPYQITHIFDLGTDKALTIFGDLGVVGSPLPQRWVLEGSAENFSAVAVAGAGAGKEKK